MIENRNTILAVILSGLVLIAWQYFYNIPTMEKQRAAQQAELAQKQAAQRISVRMTTTAINTLQGVTVIDLMCDTRVYQSNFFSSDGFHPNDNGYAILGAEVARAVTTTSYPSMHRSQRPRTSMPSSA